MSLIITNPEVWGDHKWDDFVSEDERKSLSKLKLNDRENLCPYLRRMGKYFYYCDVLSDNYSFLGLLTIDNNPNLCSPELHARRFSRNIKSLCSSCFEECDLFQEAQALEEAREKRELSEIERSDSDVPF